MIALRRSSGCGCHSRRIADRNRRNHIGKGSYVHRQAKLLPALQPAGIELTDDGSRHAGTGTHLGKSISSGYFIIAPAGAGKRSLENLPRQCLLVFGHIDGRGASGRRDGAQELRIIGLKFLPSHAETATQLRKIRRGFYRQLRDGNKYGMIRIGSGRLYAERLGIAHDLGNGEKTGNIKRRFLLELQLVVKSIVLLDDLVQIARARSFLGTTYLAFTAVVGCNGKMPVMKDVIKSGKVAGCGLRGTVGIPAFIHPPILSKSIGLARGRHELPHAHGIGTGNGERVVSAFQIRKIGKIFRKSAHTEHCLGVVEIGNAVAEKILHGSPAFTGILHKMVADLPFHGRTQIPIQLRRIGIGFFLSSGERRKRSQIHGFLPCFGRQKFRCVRRLLLPAAGKHDQHRHSCQRKAVQFANFHIIAPSLRTCISNKSRIPAREQMHGKLKIPSAEKDAARDLQSKKAFRARRTARRDERTMLFLSAMYQRMDKDTLKKAEIQSPRVRLHPIF